MNDCLVDVSNAPGTALHVFPIVTDGQGDILKVDDPEREALKLAAEMQLVLKTETNALHARPHVARGGPIAPYGDALETKRQQMERIARRVRERAYFLWQQTGCGENQADEHWRQARDFEDNNGSL